MNDISFEELMDKFLEDNKDERLTMDHPLNENSIVLDLGSYTGKWSHKLYDKYKCNIYSYEPILRFYNEHVASVGDKKIKVFNYAVDTYTGKMDMFFQNDGTSAYINNSNNCEGRVMVDTRDVVDVFLDFGRIDLTKINIEGAEYGVLDALYNSGQITKSDRYMIQFHDVEGYESKLDSVCNKLSETHKQLWGYGTIWQLWERNEAL